MSGMRGGEINRVKRHVLRQAVADNLDTIRGLPPRGLRPGRRFVRLFLRRAPLHMPSFKKHLEPGDVEALWAYVTWLRSEPRDHPH